MERTSVTKKRSSQDFMNNIIFSLLLISFVIIAAVNINVYALAFLMILAPALSINVVWVLIHTNQNKGSKNRINS